MQDAPQRPVQGVRASLLPLTPAEESYLLHTISSSPPLPSTVAVCGGRRDGFCHTHGQGPQGGGGERFSLSGLREVGGGVTKKPSAPLLDHYAPPSSLPALRPPQAAAQSCRPLAPGPPRSHCLLHPGGCCFLSAPPLLVCEAEEERPEDKNPAQEDLRRQEVWAYGLLSQVPGVVWLWGPSLF